ncbi:MAG TPA: hypothetical protein PL048_03930 [Leptospiraceae bacterium]|nr:hypothetical protein [Leptospiraceae bacterium]HMZ57899.1 hypothetical protein [Leptospiraceae bacterium]HNF16749.1 hypothetical protein [Leptospiraceae bacterium]HNF27083.1 hypothetical protein [Leptospiraceae bacterium]HNI97588.1 hypothetical protein [Leptospiraceae bacterium]
MIHQLLSMFLFIAAVQQCSVFTVSEKDVSKKTVTSVSKKIGIAVVRSPDISFRESMTALNAIVPAYKKAANEFSSGKTVFLDTFGTNYRFDFSQEYTNHSKKNILEIQHKLINEDSLMIQSYLTLGIIPGYRNLRTTLVPIVYDNAGKKHSLAPYEQPVLKEYLGWLLFPIYLFNTMNYEKYSESVMKNTIDDALKQVDETKISLADYDESYRPQNLPIRTVIGVSECKNELLHHVRRIKLKAPKGYQICFCGFSVLNDTDKSIEIKSQNFSLVYEGKEYFSKDTVRFIGKQGDVRGVSYIGDSETIPGKSSPFLQTVFGYFIVPEKGLPSTVRYSDPSISKQPIDSVFYVTAKY